MLRWTAHGVKRGTGGGSARRRDGGRRSIAFENLCDNLYEYDVPISIDEYDDLAEIARHMSIPDERWMFIGELRI
jgi:hypothetical protein